MTDIRRTIRHLFAQYQRQLVTRTIVSAGLGFGCLAALLWRLSHAGLGRWELGGIGCAGVAALVLWQWLIVRRDRLLRPRAILQIDRALGLHARLLTAVEFADVADPPPLYPRLVEEIAQTLPASLQRAPRVTNRWTVALAVALLLLLLWPRHAILPTQLAMRPPSVVQPPAPQDEPQSSKDRQRGNSGAQQDRSEGGQDSHGGQSQSSAGPSSPSGSADQSGGQDATQPSQADQGQGQSPEARNQRNHANARQAADTAKSPQSKGSQQQARDSTGRSASQQGKEGRSSTKGGSTQTGEGAGTEQGVKQLAKLSQGTGAQHGSSAGQELLKADIQQLLTELSGELKQLQAQLDADAKQHDQPSPAAGTSTDPQLYDAASQLENAAGDRLPIQLDVDTQPTATKRRGGGVAEPSKEVADARPQQQPEDVALAEQGATEQGVARQAIPPEYQPVFERLSREKEL